MTCREFVFLAILVQDIASKKLDALFSENASYYFMDTFSPKFPTFWGLYRDPFQSHGREVQRAVVA